MKYFDVIKKILSAKIYYWRTSLIPKNKNLWVFGAWKGNSYNDNTKYLFEYVMNNEPDIIPVWITKNNKVYNDLKSKNYNVYLWPQKKLSKLLEKPNLSFKQKVTVIRVSIELVALL